MYKVTNIIYSHAPGEDPARMEKAVSTALKVSLIYWRRNYLKKHFTRGGGIEYGYRERAKYRDKRAQNDRRGSAEGAKNNPLVWTGTLRQMVLGQFPQPRISRAGGTQTAGIVFKVPNYVFYTKIKTGQSIMRMYEELTTTSERETIAMERIISETIDAQMSGARASA